MDELTNPYRPGAGTPPPALTGRDELINRFGIAFRRAVAGRPGKSLLMIGLRGAGKTVLLNRFAEIAEQEGFRVGLIEAPEHGHFPTLLASRLRRILLPLSSNVVSTAVTRDLDRRTGGFPGRLDRSAGARPFSDAPGIPAPPHPPSPEQQRRLDGGDPRARSPNRRVSGSA